MTVLYRCTYDDCRKRVSLPRKKERYVRPPRCPGCGRKLVGRPDREPKLRAKRNRCDCHGYWFPHRGGSGVWCVQSARQPTDRDYEARGYSAARVA